MFLWGLARPVPLGLIVGCVVLYFFSTQVEDRVFAAVLALIVSTLSGFVGNVLHKHWSDATEESSLVGRGSSAIRHLGLHLHHLVDLERWASSLASSSTAVNSVQPQVFSELMNRSRLLQQDVLTAIEDWRDLIPAAGIRARIGDIADREADVLRLMAELDELRNQLAATSDADSGELSRLQESIARRDAELADLRRQLREAEREAESTGVPAVALASRPYDARDDRNDFILRMTLAGDRRLTFEDIVSRILYVPEPELRESLDAMVRSGRLRFDEERKTYSLVREPATTAVGAA